MSEGQELELEFVNGAYVIKEDLIKSINKKEVEMLEQFCEKISEYEISTNKELSPMMDAIWELFTVVLESSEEHRR